MSQAQFEDIAWQNFELSEKQEQEQAKSLICDECDIPLEIFGISLTCPQCGMKKPYEAEDEISYVSRGLYTDCDDDTVEFRIKGAGGTICPRKKTTSPANKLTQKRNTERQMLSFAHMKTGGCVIPNYIYKKAGDLYFDHVQKYMIKRADVRVGIMAACVYYECVREELARKPTEIAQALAIDKKYINKGFKTLHALVGLGLIDIPIHVDTKPHFVKRYFELLRIDKIYVKFVLDIIQFSLEYRIAASSQDISRVVGAIYVLIECLGSPVSKEYIAEKCSISKATFARFFKCIKDVWIGRSNDKKIRLETIMQTNYPYPHLTL